MLAAAFLTSAIPFEKEISVGEKAPKIETTKGANILGDANSDGKMRLISFWTPKKPASRITNRELSQKYGDSNQEVEFISICADSDEELMKEVMKIDGLKDVNAYSYSEISSRAFKDYNADENPRAFLIDLNGKILNIL